MKCSLCPRRCNAERTDTSNSGGFCRMPLLPVVARATLHFWEEPIISGKNGSGTVFFSGCSLGCVYCQNAAISQNGGGKVISTKRLAEIFRELEEKGAHNINLVNPTHFVPAVKEALSIYKPHIPVVYNSGGYDTPQAIAALRDEVDIFLMDFKYLSPQRAAKYSGAPDYPAVAAAAIRQCVKQQPECVLRGGILQKGVLIRHLLLPLATREAMDVFDWVCENAPGAYFSLMSQYIPVAGAHRFPEINRRVTQREIEKVIAYIADSGRERVFVQERTSGSERYIPDFESLEGI